MRRKYNFGVGVESDWTAGSHYTAGHPMSPDPLCEGENLEVDPPRRLVQSFTALWGEDVRREGTSRVTWEIEPIADSCRLTVTHDQLREDANDETVRRLADDPLRPQDAARDRRDAHHARLAPVRAGPGARRLRPRPGLIEASPDDGGASSGLAPVPAESRGGVPARDRGVDWRGPGPHAEPVNRASAERSQR